MSQKDHRYLLSTYLLFGIVVVFLTVNLVNFMANKKMTYSMAEKGEIIEVDHYKGIVLRNEEVYSTLENGTLVRNMEDGAYVKKNMLICSLDRNEDMTQIIDSEIKSNEDSISARVVYSSEAFKPLMADFKNYIVNTSTQEFDEIYQMRETLKADLDVITVNQDPDTASNIGDLEKKNQQYEEQKQGNMTQFLSDKSGIISYYFDGFEGYTLDQLADVVAGKVKKKENENQRDLYKLINNKEWYLIIKSDAKLEKLLDENEGYLTINYAKNDLTMTGSLKEIRAIDGKNYAIIVFSKYLDYVLKERNINFSIVYADYNGIKIPNSALKSMSFYEFPVEYVNLSGSGIKLKKLTTSDNKSSDATGLTTEEFIPELYYRESDDSPVIYIPVENGPQPSDIFVSFETTDHTMSPMKTKVIPGVIIRNKGFDAFKVVEIIYQGDEYSIVKEDVPFGVRLYDRILVDIKSEGKQDNSNK